MLFLKYLFFVGFVILLNSFDVKPLPCSTCPKQIVAEASESSSCGASEECDGSTPSSTTTTATTTTAKSNSSSEEGDESGTVRTAILAIAIRTLTNGSSEERCSTSDCSSNGICFGHRSKPLCLCYKGFCGILCKQAVCPGHRGCNGHGWCLATSESAKCLCQPDYGGKHCEKSKNRRAKAGVVAGDGIGCAGCRGWNWMYWLPGMELDVLVAGDGIGCAGCRGWNWMYWLPGMELDFRTFVFVG